jgi:proteic killer suppression protein
MALSYINPLTIITRTVIIGLMIKTFADKETQKIFNRQFSRKRPHEIQALVKRKLDFINVAGKLDDLKVPPGNCLEQLHGDREGQHSIRINDQWRICFYWIDDDACDVELTDYH